MDITVPTLGESVTSATVARWLKQVGQTVAADEPLVELETDKVTVEVNAPVAGRLETILTGAGTEVAVGQALGAIGGAPATTAEPQRPVAPSPVPPPAAPPPPRPVAPLPAAAKLLAEHGVPPAALAPGSGKDGRITKGDVLAYLHAPPPADATQPALKPAEERVKMTRLRRTIAARLKEAQNTAAMLTTFNEVDMSACIALRAAYRDAFEKKFSGIRLGYMSFFVRACVAAAGEFPAVNAEIDGDEIVYKHYIHMGIAVGGPNGLVVPVIRHAEKLGFAEIEHAIANFGKAARDGALKLEDLAGGSFSITNGGIYGSLMSTPILNPPQSAILGMHKIQDRPVAVAGKVEIRPMMYLALTYDHRIVDGKEAVGFLVRVKESIEDPRRLLLGL